MPDRADYASDITLIDHLVALKLVPDWGAIEATDIDLEGEADIPDATFGYPVIYTVPNGKTLLIYDWSAGFVDGDGQFYAELTNYTTYVVLGIGGGTRGFQTPLNKAKRVASGETIAIAVVHNTGATRFVGAHFGGVLI